jgi:hypothetical protein
MGDFGTKKLLLEVPLQLCVFRLFLDLRQTNSGIFDVVLVDNFLHFGKLLPRLLMALFSNFSRSVPIFR